MKYENENLEELFGKFMNKDAARQAANDISDDEQILSKYPAPKPDENLLSAINLKVNKKLQRHKHNRSVAHFSYWAAAAAAVILIVGLISITKIDKPQQPKKISDNSAISSIWETDDLSQDDPSLSLLIAKLQEIEDEAVTIKENGYSSYSTQAEELEIEFMEISNDFWKG